MRGCARRPCTVGATAGCLPLREPQGYQHRFNSIQFHDRTRWPTVPRTHAVSAAHRNAHSAAHDRTSMPNSTTPPPALADRLAAAAAVCLGRGFADLPGAVDQAARARGGRGSASGHDRRQRFFRGPRRGRLALRQTRRPSARGRCACMRCWKPACWCWRSPAPWRWPHAAAPFAALQDQIGPLAWALPFALVGLPAVLMGGTLPVLMRARLRSGEPCRPRRRTTVCCQYGRRDCRHAGYLLPPDPHARRARQRVCRRRVECGSRAAGIYPHSRRARSRRARSRSRPRTFGRHRRWPSRDASAPHPAGARDLRDRRRYCVGLRGGLVADDRAIHQHPQFRLLRRAGHLFARAGARQRAGVADGSSECAILGARLRY